MILSNQPDFQVTLRKGGRSSITKRSCKSERQSIAENCSHPPSPKSKKFKSSTSKSSIFKIEQKHLQSIDFVCRRTLRLYESNLEHYKLNQGKLTKAIENQFQERNLNYQQKILLFLRNRNICQLKIGLNIQTLQSQLEILNQFLTELYEKKRIKQIKILKENFKEEQTLIANQLDLQKLVKLHQNTAFKQTNTNMDFLTEYQNICRKFGAVEPNLKSHIGIRKQLNYCQREIVDHFEQLRRLKTQGMSLKRKKIEGQKMIRFG